MKFAKLFTVAVIVSAFATSGFAGTCCSKKKKSGDEKPKTEQTEEKK